MPGSLFAPRAARLTVLFDEDCGLCRWTAQQLHRLDRGARLELVPLQHAASHPERPDLARLAAQYPLAESIHVQRDDGRVRAGGDAMLEILDALPGGALLRPWALLPGVAAVVGAAYRRIAGNRALVGRLIGGAGTRAPACDLRH